MKKVTLSQIINDRDKEMISYHKRKKKEYGLKLEKLEEDIEKYSDLYITEERWIRGLAARIGSFNKKNKKS